MEMNNLISVIIPVFNVEQYLSQCLDSICNQTYKALEIIVIDDGSTDSSGRIADQYASQDKRILVRHIQNRGAAGARNYALSICSGSYVSFIDSDDWLELDFYEKMISSLIGHSSDIAQCCFFRETLKISERQIRKNPQSVISDQEFIKDMLYHWEDALVWNKIFKRSIMRGIFYPEGRCIDDEFFTYKIIMNANTISFVDEALYHYRIRKSSAMHNEEKRLQRLRDQFDFTAERFPLLVNKYPELKPDIVLHMTNIMLRVIRRTNSDTDTNKKARQMIWKHLFEILTCKKIGVKNKIKVLKTISTTQKNYNPKPGKSKVSNFYD